jgi:spermidine synthase
MSARRLVVACYGASGAAALIYQVAWVRMFTLAFGHTTASSSIVLGAFMCGLALGSWIAGRMRLSPSRALAKNL